MQNIVPTPKRNEAQHGNWQTQENVGWLGGGDKLTSIGTLLYTRFLPAPG